ncbi:hypothetical protein NKH44_05250, partial [Mesorhizobium sp. M1121]
MPAFAYRAYLVDGSTESGVLDASTKQEAARKLAQQGRRSYHLAPVSSDRPQLRLPGRSALTFTRKVDLSRLFSELSVLLNAGFTVEGPPADRGAPPARPPPPPERPGGVGRRPAP